MHAEWLAFLKQIVSEAPESPAPQTPEGSEILRKIRHAGTILKARGFE
jgi:hypothetical protein